MKRLLDIVSAAAFLALAWPILAAIAIAVRLDTPGSVIFRHQRIGLHGTSFDVLKFRTMTAAAGGPQLTTGTDARITRVGAMLRRYKLDELPQLVNVLRGDMSIVGPRPEVERYVDAFPREYGEILSVRPGMTDPASLLFHNEQEILAEFDDPERHYLETLLPQKLELSARYVREQSFRGDIVLIFKTIAAIAR